MPESIPQIDANISSVDDLLDVVIKQNKFLNWLVSTLANNGVLDLDGLTVYDNSIINRMVNDVNGSKLHDLSVDNIKIAALDGAKLYDLSVANEKIISMIGSKLFDLSVAWAKLYTTELHDTTAIGPIAPGETRVYRISHTAFQFYGPPLIRPAGYNETYSFCINEKSTFGNFSDSVYFQIFRYSPDGFHVRVENATINPVAFYLEWIRRGIF